MYISKQLSTLECISVNNNITRVGMTD